MKYVFILSPSLPFDLKYVELWHARVLLLYNTNHLTALNAAVKKGQQVNHGDHISQVKRIRAGEVILSGGAINSPQLLLLSGVF